MQQQSDHHFESYVRDKMKAMRRTPSQALWDRIAAEQSLIRRRFLFRNLLIRGGLGVSLLLILSWAFLLRPPFPNEPVPVGQHPVAEIREDNATPSIRSVGTGRQASGSPELITLNRESAGKNFVNQESGSSIPPLPTRREIGPATPPRRGLSRVAEHRGLKIYSGGEQGDNLRPTGDLTLMPADPKTPGEQHKLTRLAPDSTALSVYPQSLLLLPLRHAPVFSSVENRMIPAVGTLIYAPIKPQRSPRFSYGLAFTGGKLHASNNWESHYFGAGIQFQYRLTQRVQVYGGLEWVRGNCLYHFKASPGGLPEFSKEKFPYLPALPQAPPLGPLVQLQSSWTGLSMPLGATLNGALPFQGAGWLFRLYYKPQIALQRKNRLSAPLTSADNQVFENPKQEWRAGWVGAQVGLDYRILRHWRLECTLNAEQALEPVTLEQVKYQAFSLRLAIFRR